MRISFFPAVVMFLLLATHVVSGQQIRLLTSNNKISLRGLSVVNDRVAWVSGSNGTIGRTVDGGENWLWLKVKGYESRDFRDIEAFDAVTAVIIAVAEPAIILKTINGGKSWKLVYENKTPGMFLNAMEFWNEESGIVVGDPVKGKFFIARTFNGGNTWQDIPVAQLPVADNGEACFAASGTNVRALDRDEACFVSGGSRSRLFWKGKPIDLPLLYKGETAGANSIAVNRNRNRGDQLAIVGGDFTKDTLRSGNCIVSRDGGRSWIKPSSLPTGYRSCVEYISSSKLITCGLTGVDVSFDEGINWNNISSVGFHVCRKAKKGKAVFLAGGDGRIAKLVW